MSKEPESQANGGCFVWQCGLAQGLRGMFLGARSLEGGRRVRKGFLVLGRRPLLSALWHLICRRKRAGKSVLSVR